MSKPAFVFDLLRWDGAPAIPAVRLSDGDAERAVTFSAAFPTGKIDFEMIKSAAPLLRSILGAERFAGTIEGSELLELFAESPIPALTDVPWEAAARNEHLFQTTQAKLFEQLLASLPVCRVISGTPVAIEGDGFRPRLLLLISNPPGIGGGALQVAQIRNACQQVLKEYPAFHIRIVGPTATWAAVAPIIVQFEPTVLVVAAHGSSNPQGGGPTLAFVREHDQFAVDRVPVDELADCLARAGTCRIVALIACDLVRASEKSGAIQLVKHGVPEVVAMQGSIDQLVARPFLARLLGELLAGQTVPLAAAAARRSVCESAHAIFPTVFRAASLTTGAGPLADLSTLYARALATLDARVAVSSPFLLREALEMSVRGILESEGVALVSGGFGNGTSTLLRRSISSSLRERRNRPILYLDCDRRLADESLGEWMAREFADATRAHSILRPKSAPDFIGKALSAEEMGTWAAESEISLVIDNLPHRPTESETTFLKMLMASFGGPDRHAVLVLAVRGPLATLTDQPLSIVVPPFSSDEVGEYAEQFLPDADAQALYQRTGGTPLLLDLDRRMTRGANRTGEPRNEEMLPEYLDRLQDFLSVPAREAAVRLVQFNQPLDQRLILEFVTPDLGAALDELIEVGLALSFEQQNVTWILVPQRKRSGFLIAGAPSAQAKLAELFTQRYEAASLEVVRQVADLGGAGEYLRFLQEVLAQIDRLDVSIDIPFQAQGTKLPARELFVLFETAVKLFGIERQEVPDVLIAAARAALVVGRLDRAEEWLEELPASLSLQNECEALALRVILAKDRQQTEGIAEVLAYQARILELTAEVGDPADAEWQRVRRETVFDTLPALLFLIGEPADSMARSLAPSLSKFTADERAQLLATFAEREMREPPEQRQWNQIAEWVTEAAALLTRKSDSRAKGYVLYQCARYLAKRLEPQIHEAHELFEQSRAAAEHAGEARRQGLALLRLGELEAAHAELRAAQPADWPQQRLQELDALAVDLREASSDSLSMRVLGRLQQWGAAHEPHAEQRRDRLIQAARALGMSALSSRSDKRRFAEVCVKALDAELGIGGRFLAAQRFLASLRFDIAQKLNISVPMDSPSKAREAIWATILGLN